MGRELLLLAGRQPHGMLLALRDRDVDLEAAPSACSPSTRRAAARSRRRVPAGVRSASGPGPASPARAAVARPAETTDGLLVPTGGGRAWDPNNFMRRVFKPAGAAIGVPDLTFHDLRHTGASLMIAAGCNVKVIAEQMGHADGGALVLRRYGHLYSGARRRAALALEQHLFGSPTPPARSVWGRYGMTLNRRGTSDDEIPAISDGRYRLRTCDLLRVRQALWPAELTAHRESTYHSGRRRPATV